MFGIFLASIATFFGEISSSIGKWEVGHKKENLYTMGFLNVLGAVSFFLVLIVFVDQRFWINLAFWPWTLVLMGLSTLQGYITVQAITRAERSTFSFIRTGTIPLVLLIDLISGYRLSPIALLGIMLILLSFVVLYKNHGVSRKGIGWVILSAVNAAFAISLYKFLITTAHNPVSSLYFLLLLPELILFFILARLVYHQNPFSLLKKRAIVAQTVAQGFGVVFSGFAYLFAPASILVTADRSFSVIWAFLFGHQVFHEKRFFLKGCIATVILAGILLLPG